LAVPWEKEISFLGLGPATDHLALQFFFVSLDLFGRGIRRYGRRIAPHLFAKSHICLGPFFKGLDQLSFGFVSGLRSRRGCYQEDGEKYHQRLKEHA
jgi:hypothetical protein